MTQDDSPFPALANNDGDFRDWQTQQVQESLPELIADLFGFAAQYAQRMRLAVMIREARSVELAALWAAETLHRLYASSGPRRRAKIEATWQAVRAAMLGKSALVKSENLTKEGEEPHANESDT